jgi:hypothetical protein
MSFWDDINPFKDPASKYKQGKLKTPTKFTPFKCSCNCVVIPSVSVSNEVFVTLRCSGCGKAETLYVE